MAHDNHNDQHHITPLSVYIKVAAVLFILTFLTIGVHSIREHLGPIAPFLAFGIAGVKAFLVMAWFMHLKYDVLLNRVIFAMGFLFLMLLFLITALDIYSRVPVTSVL